MRITSPKGNYIATLEQWGNCIRHTLWREGRSAYSLADFILNRNGVKILESRISSVLSQPVRLERATPEVRAKFDHYRGNPSNLDLGVCGRVGSKSSLFVGLEAKVDERFGNKTVCERYQAAIRELSRNPRSKALDRVKDLLSLYFADTDDPCDSRFSDIGYQLLTGTAGTVARQKDASIFYVLVFTTREYDKRKGQDNQRNYEKFIEATNGKVLTQDSEGFYVHELTVAGKRLVCIYDYFHIP